MMAIIVTAFFCISSVLFDGCYCNCLFFVFRQCFLMVVIVTAYFLYFVSDGCYCTSHCLCRCCFHAPGHGVR